MTAIAIEMRRTLSDILCPRSRYARLTTGINAAVQRYAAKKKPAKGQKELRWITIGGGDDGGGTHVQVDGDGKITAGPKGLADKGVKKLSDFGGERDGGATTAQRRRNDGATTAQRPKESGVTESEAASRKWKKNDDGTYTAPNGTVWKKAASGGEESPVNGKQYAGGSLMPIHGQSKARIEKGDGTGDVVDMKPGSPDDRNGTEAKLSKPKRTFQDRTRDRMGDLVNVPEGHRAIEKILAGSPGKSRRLPDEALAYLGLTRKQARDLADIWEADGGSAYIPVEIVPPSTASSRHAPTDEWDIAAKFKEWKDGKAKAARAVDADMSKLDPEMMLTAAQVPPTKATESQGTSKQKEAEESAQQSAAGDAAKAAGNPVSPKAGDTYDFPAIGDRSPIGLRVTAVNDSHVGVGMKDSDLTWVKIPKGSFHSFIQDMSGKIEVPETDDPHISRIRSGEAKMLGRGDDGLVFDTGDGKVTKVSTTTPFQPLNPFHRTTEEAKKRAIEQFNVAKTLHQAGVPGIPRMSVKEHGGRVFTTRENLTIPEKLTTDQLRQARDSIRAMHDQGYSLNDDVQIGIGADGKAYHFDLGKAAKAGHADDYKGDQDRLDRLAEKSGLGRIAINPRKEWEGYKEMLGKRKEADDRRVSQGKDGLLTKDFRRIVGGEVSRLRDQMISENPSEASMVRAEYAEIMGEPSPLATSGQIDKSESKSTSTPPPAKPTIPGAQTSLFGGDDVRSGQQSLFNVAKPAKGGKKSVAPDLLSGVATQVRQFLEQKGTISPADVAGTSLQGESLAGQREMFSRSKQTGKD